MEKMSEYNVLTPFQWKKVIFSLENDLFTQHCWILVISYYLKPIKLKQDVLICLNNSFCLNTVLFNFFFNTWKTFIWRISLRFCFFVSAEDGWQISKVAEWGTLFLISHYVSLYFKSSLVCLMSSFMNISSLCKGWSYP